MGRALVNNEALCSELSETLQRIKEAGICTSILAAKRYEDDLKRGVTEVIFLSINFCLCRLICINIKYLEFHVILTN